MENANAVYIAIHQDIAKEIETNDTMMKYMQCIVMRAAETIKVIGNRYFVEIITKIKMLKVMMLRRMSTNIFQ